MNKTQLTSWLEQLKHAWETKNPNAALDLVASSFIWHETPFQKPFTSTQELLNEWQSVLDHKDVQMTYDILCMDKNVGMVKWHATFSRISSGENVEMDGIYQVSLDENGKCTEFHQWFNTR